MALTKEFSEPVLEHPPELSERDIERVVELTDFPRERVRTILDVSSRAGLGRDMLATITRDLAMILCALHGLGKGHIVASRDDYRDVPF